MSLTKATFSMIDAGTFNAKDTGAIGDGTTDNTTEIQTTFDLANADTGSMAFTNENVRISINSSTYPVGLGVVNFEDLDWPLNADVTFQGPTRETVLFKNNISTPYQVLPVITTAWVALTAYSIGQKVVNGAQAYMVVSGGTSAASGGPTGTGLTIVDGTVTWRSINNGLFSGIPVNEFRVGGPYNPAIIMDAKTEAFYGGAYQPAHQIALDLAAAGGGNSSAFTTLAWAKNGTPYWYAQGEGPTGALSFTHFRLSDGQGRYNRMWFQPETGDLAIQRVNAAYPLDVAGAMRLTVDRSVNSVQISDNYSTYTTGPVFYFENKTSAGVVNTSTVRLDGATGAQISVNAARTAGVDSSLALTTQNAAGDIKFVSVQSAFPSFEPNPDNSLSLGRSSARWTTVYATTGTINTSDENAKEQIRGLSDVELVVALKIKKLIRAFKFKDAVATKGDNARIHFGVIAQDVAAAFEAEGLDANQYGLFCSDTLEDGSVRLGIRYEELLAFVIASM